MEKTTPVPLLVFVCCNVNNILKCIMISVGHDLGHVTHILWTFIGEKEDSNGKSVQIERSEKDSSTPVTSENMNEKTEIPVELNESPEDASNEKNDKEDVETQEDESTKRDVTEEMKSAKVKPVSQVEVSTADSSTDRIPASEDQVKKDEAEENPGKDAESSNEAQKDVNDSGESQNGAGSSNECQKGVESSSEKSKHAQSSNEKQKEVEKLPESKTDDKPSDKSQKNMENKSVNGREPDIPLIMDVDEIDDSGENNLVIDIPSENDAPKRSNITEVYNIEPIEIDCETPAKPTTDTELLVDAARKLLASTQQVSLPKDGSNVSKAASSDKVKDTSGVPLSRAFVTQNRNTGAVATVGDLQHTTQGNIARSKPNILQKSNPRYFIVHFTLHPGNKKWPHTISGGTIIEYSRKSVTFCLH